MLKDLTWVMHLPLQAQLFTGVTTQCHAGSSSGLCDWPHLYNSHGICWESEPSDNHHLQLMLHLMLLNFGVKEANKIVYVDSHAQTNYSETNQRRCPMFKKIQRDNKPKTREQKRSISSRKTDVKLRRSTGPVRGSQRLWFLQRTQKLKAQWPMIQSHHQKARQTCKANAKQGLNKNPNASRPAKANDRARLEVEKNHTGSYR